MKWLEIGLICLILFIILWKIHKKKQQIIRSYFLEPYPIAIIIQILNQEEIIEAVIRHLRKIQKQTSLDIITIIIDKGSKDRTHKILYKMWQEKEDFHLYHLQSTSDPNVLLQKIQGYCDNRIIYQIELQRSTSLKKVIRGLKNSLQTRTTNEIVKITDNINIPH